MIDLEEYYQTQDLIDKIEIQRVKPNYNEYLQNLSIDSDYTEIEMTLQLLSQMDYSEVLPHEEEFVLRMLECDKVPLQGEALNALLLWENTTQLERVKKVKIENSYLQEDLDDFITEMENKQ